MADKTDTPAQPAITLGGDGQSLPSGDRTDEAYQALLGAARELVERIHQRQEEIRRLLRVTENINRGLALEEVLELFFEELRPFIPFNRIGCALIEERHGMVVAHWARSDRPIHLGKGFRAPLAGSTLADIVRTGRPRIIGDLPAYLEQKPQSLSTELIVHEGMRSSLTCPLVVRGRPVGFLFFNSEKTDAYSDAHIEFFQQIAGQLSTIVEKGRLYSELAEKAALIEQQNKQLLEQMELARRFQRAMIPAESLHLEGLDTAFAYEPVSQVGGDLFDLIPLADQKTLVFIGDAMGHGVEAAMVMAAAKTALLTALAASAEPAALMARINDEMYKMLTSERFVTAACARLDPAAATADLVLAGHLNPIHMAARGGRISRPNEAGVPLGVRPGLTFETVRVPFERGDTLVFFTDGVIETRDDRRELYGDERLTAVVARHAGNTPAELLQAIRADLNRFAGHNGRTDDVSILIVRSSPPNAPAA